jgi:protein-disulfide isomerase
MRNKIYSEKNNKNTKLKIMITLCVILFGLAYFEREKIKRAFLPDNYDMQSLIKQTIIDNPTIIIDAIKQSQNIERQKMVESIAEYYKDNKDKIEQSALSPKIGKQDSDIKLVYFSDYNCRYCNIFSKMLHKLLEENKDIEVIYKNTPILGDESYFVAKVAIALNKIDKQKFQLFHEKMNSGKMTRKQIIEFVASLGVSEVELEKIMQNQEIDNEIISNMQIMRGLNISGTPALLVNGELVTERSEDGIKKLIELKRAK